MVPAPRLLFLAAAVLLPGALLAAVTPERAGLALIAMLTLVAAAAIDAALGTGALRGVRVETPPTTRLHKDREGDIELVLVRDKAVPDRLRLALAVPRELTFAAEFLDVELGAVPRAKARWKVTPRMRGNFPLTWVGLEKPSPLGLWAVRRRQPLSAELRVYPDLMSDRRAAAAVFLNRGQYGSHAIRAAGRGREFEKLRDYQHGDSPDEIHWKATARRGRPVSKVFQIERTQEVHVLVDASRLSGRTESVPTGKGAVPGESRLETSLERSVNAALLLGLAAERQGDLFGLVTFSDQVHRRVRAGSGAAHFSACRDALHTVQPRAVTPDFDELCATLRTGLRKRSLLVFLTALDDPILAESFARNMEQLARQHLVLVAMVTPPEVRPLFSDDEPATLDDIYRELGGHLRWQDLRELEVRLRGHGVRFENASRAELVPRLLSQYAAIKRRQLL